MIYSERPMTINTLEDLFVYDLQQFYYVEKRFVDILGDLVDDANNDNVFEGFSDHRDETRHHVGNVDRVFEAIGHEPEERSNQMLTRSLRNMKNSSSNPTMNILTTSTTCKRA
jgi:ferritin-like metal-binding protein YciE